ncbi:hypothetical protein GCM10009839_21540 [Catenulispora yoronensis]|uniref:Uncharacterized protein n=1 Tax=Catenulispora yoronensis TaxID=450799 RepID=A0ABN2TYF9_9ACTN
MAPVSACGAEVVAEAEADVLAGVLAVAGVDGDVAAVFAAVLVVASAAVPETCVAEVCDADEAPEVPAGADAASFPDGGDEEQAAANNSNAVPAAAVRTVRRIPSRPSDMAPSVGPSVRRRQGFG